MLVGMVFSPEEVNIMLRFVVEFLMLLLGTSVGTFAREAIYPQQNTFRQNMGWLLLSTTIAFGITVKFHDHLTMAYTFLICVASGFFIPVFKDWFRDKKLLKIAVKAAKKTSSLSESLLDSIDEELEEDDKRG